MAAPSKTMASAGAGGSGRAFKRSPSRLAPSRRTGPTAGASLMPRRGRWRALCSCPDGRLRQLEVAVLVGVARAAHRGGDGDVVHLAGGHVVQPPVRAVVVAGGQLAV